MLGLRTVLEEESIALKEFYCHAVFIEKHVIHIVKAVGPYFLSSALKHHSVIPICLPVNNTLCL
jgi:hypothetical protein